jgi:UDP-N-acetylmuramoyl-L-alanyl-D-glutamate--2,6-diaminopimelate ligase
MIKSILEKAGFKVGLIGTIANYIGDRRIPSQRTTPESLELHALFNEMVAEGVNYCIMEVSSHSLALDRVYGIKFTSGIFSNLTQDHLDFHKNFEEYFNAKYRLFQNSKYSIINIDDEYGKRIFNNIDNNKITYSVEHHSDVKADHIYMHSTGVDFNIKYQGVSEKISLKIPGRYNVYNALCSAAVCFNEGVKFDEVREGLEKVLVPGRCEIVTHNYKLGYEIIIDYAHTPDGLENILKTVREFTKGRVISVFGCGGDRDKTKRPIMGKLGTELSDIAIITSDNPRSEEPNTIIDDIVMGISKKNYIIVENRRLAIEKAIDIAEKYDVIVIAGKGHEDYQELKDKVIHFDEREIVKEIIEKQKILGGE